MKKLTTITTLFITLASCLTSSAEILVYKHTESGTFWTHEDGEWVLDKGPWKAYLILNLNHDNYTIEDAKFVGYRQNANGKWFRQNSVDLQLVRVPYGAKVQWVVMATEVNVDQELITGGSFHMLAGPARSRSVGTATKREVPNKLAGYGLQDETEGEVRDIGLSTLSATLYPAWTYWANGAGNQDFDTTLGMITDYLTSKGYVERP